jgi:hypothetical protein
MRQAPLVLQALRYFMVEVGKGCECTRTGKPIIEKLVERLHRKDVAKEEKIVSLRLKNIELRHKYSPAAPHDSLPGQMAVPGTQAPSTSACTVRRAA